MKNGSIDFGELGFGEFGFGEMGFGELGFRRVGFGELDSASWGDTFYYGSVTMRTTSIYLYFIRWPTFYELISKFYLHNAMLVGIQTPNVMAPN